MWSQHKKPSKYQDQLFFVTWHLSVFYVMLKHEAFMRKSALPLKDLILYSGFIVRVSFEDEAVGGGCPFRGAQNIRGGWSQQLFNEHRDLFLWKRVFPWKLWKPYPGLFKLGNMGKVSTTTWALFSQFKVRREYFALQSHSSGRQYSGGGVAGGRGGGERGQEIRIRVINNFCSVINHKERRSIPQPWRHTPILMSSSLLFFSFTTFFFHPKCYFKLMLDVFSLIPYELHHIY